MVSVEYPGGSADDRKKKSKKSKSKGSTRSRSGSASEVDETNKAKTSSSGNKKSSRKEKGDEKKKSKKKNRRSSATQASTQSVQTILTGEDTATTATAAAAATAATHCQEQQQHTGAAAAAVASTPPRKSAVNAHRRIESRPPDATSRTTKASFHSSSSSATAAAAAAAAAGTRAASPFDRRSSSSSACRGPIVPAKGRDVTPPPPGSKHSHHHRSSAVRSPASSLDKSSSAHGESNPPSSKRSRAKKKPRGGGGGPKHVPPLDSPSPSLSPSSSSSVIKLLVGATNKTWAVNDLSDRAAQQIGKLLSEQGNLGLAEADTLGNILDSGTMESFATKGSDDWDDGTFVSYATRSSRKQKRAEITGQGGKEGNDGDGRAEDAAAAADGFSVVTHNQTFVHNQLSPKGLRIPSSPGMPLAEEQQSRRKNPLSYHERKPTLEQGRKSPAAYENKPLFTFRRGDVETTLLPYSAADRFPPPPSFLGNTIPGGDDPRSPSRGQQGRQQALSPRRLAAAGTTAPTDRLRWHDGGNGNHGTGNGARPSSRTSGREETMEDLVRRLQAQGGGNSGILRFSKQDAEHIRNGKRCVQFAFPLSKKDDGTGSRSSSSSSIQILGTNEFGKLTVSEVLAMTPERPIIVDIRVV